MSFVHTAFGRGQIIGEETVRGRKQYLVAGSGFQMWIDEADAQIHTGAADFDFEPAEDVNEENSTDLPYDPTPQFPVEMFADEQTIQPNHELDADDRLSPADSLTFDSVDDREYPGPGEHLFAHRHAGLSKDRNYPEADDFIDWLGTRHYPEIYHAYDPDIRAQYADEAKRSPEEMEDLARMLEDPYFGSNDDPVIMEGTRHLAGLSDKYIQIEADADHYNDPVVRFRDDPIREINRVGYMLSDMHDDDRMDHYAALVDSDSHIREAAWSDVRQKAQRIRREGKMDVHDIDDNKIYATVHGDHGDYDVMIVKGGLGGNSITQWTCSCDWGRHAFKRKVLHVGRLCSHGLAGWLEMQSHELGEAAKKHPYKKRADVVDDYTSYNDENNDGHVDKATVDNFISQPHEDGGIEPMTPEDVTKLYNYVEDNKTQPGRRNYEVPYTFDPDKVYKAADVLRTQPHSLTPDLRFVPEGEDSHFEDVEEDERETTGPEQIVHFSRRYYAGEELDPEPYRDFDGGGELLDELREESSTPLEEDFGNMRDRNDDVREIVEELREKGYDADQFVASRQPGTERNRVFIHHLDSRDNYDPYDPNDSRNPYNYSDDPYHQKSKSEKYMDDLPFEKDYRNYRIGAAWGDHLPEDCRPSSMNPDDWSEAEWQDMLLPDAAEMEEAAADVYRNIRNRKRMEQVERERQMGREASYGVNNQGAGPGGAFGQPGGGNWADQPFAGSGPDPKFWYESSEDYVDAHERPRYEDVTDLGDDDIIKYTKDKPQQRKTAWMPGKHKRNKDRPLLPEDYEEADDAGRGITRLPSGEQAETLVVRRHHGSVGSDPIEQFYSSGAAESLKSGSRSSGGSFSDDAIAANASQFLMRTAGRNYSLSEQRELEEEEHHLGARNLDGLDLTGTHYIS